MTDSEPLDLTQYQEIHGIEATNVLAARDFYTVGNPYDRTETPDSRPTFGLDGFLTDEFDGTNFPLIHVVLQGPRILPTPRLISEDVRNSHLTDEAARSLLSVISPHRSWDTSPYVAQVRERLEE